MRLVTKITFTSARRASGIAVIAGLVSIGLVWPEPSGGTSPSEYAVPSEIESCLKALGSSYRLCGTLNPFYLRADFDGDGHIDHAVSTTRSGLQGIAICWGVEKPAVVLGAGAEFAGWDKLDFTAWQVYPRSRPVERGAGERKPPRLSADAILMIWEEASSAIAYWNGKEFVKYQQGD